MRADLHYRHSVIELLRDIAALNAGAGPVELVCGWFDDLYAPAEASQHTASVTWKQHLGEWEECFSQAELRALCSFNQVFESVEGRLSTDPVSFASDPNWAKVSEAAKEALRVLEKRVA